MSCQYLKMNYVQLNNCKLIGEQNEVGRKHVEPIIVPDEDITTQTVLTITILVFKLHISLSNPTQ